MTEKSKVSEQALNLKGSLRLADIVTESVVDGKGIRFTIFVQGCPHRCEGCQNPSTHSLDGGVMMPLTEVAALILKNPLLSGVTYSGGEPFLFPSEFSELSRFVHDNGMDVWCYSGYTLEEILKLGEDDPRYTDMLEGIDILVDGRFILAEKDALLVFKGSRNQRIIDLKAMREKASGEIILLEV